MLLLADRRLVASTVVLLLLSAPPLTCAALPRGVHPDAAHLYKPETGQFTCTDSSLTVPFARVNDDYCDCIDGSDEPGTSACHNGRFYCANRGHEPKFMSTAFVDDGICDCCDGSDEGSGRCTNNCLEHSAPAFEALKQSVSEYWAALQQRPTYMQIADAQREAWSARVHTISGEVEAKEAELQAALKLKAQAEQENKKLLEDRQQAQPATQQEDTQQQDTAGYLAAADGGLPAADHGDAAQQGETPEERGRRIASQWTTDPAAAAGTERQGMNGKASVAGSESARPMSRIDRKRAGEQLSEWQQFLMFGDLIRGYFSSWGAWLKMLLREGIKRDVLERRDKARARREQLLKMLTGRPSYTQPPPRALQTSIADDDMSDDLRKAISHAIEVESQVQALRKEQQDLLRFAAARSNKQWGADGAFFALAGKCFEDREAHWTYTLCFFDGAIQRVNYANSGGTQLGTWQGLVATSDDTGNASLQAVVQGGEACQYNYEHEGSSHTQMIPRTFKVKLMCGEGDRLYDTTEVSLCTYEGRFKTPAACSEDEYRRLYESLAVMEQQREALRAELTSEKQPHDEL